MLPPPVKLDLYFNPRSPRGERHQTRGIRVRPHQFQSTLPARGATLVVLIVMVIDKYFNPRSPRGERHGKHGLAATGQAISIHAPREGSDLNDIYYITSGSISIHAPREGSDEYAFDNAKNKTNFNPRSPRGERRIYQLSSAEDKSEFQSTLPARGATSNAGDPRTSSSISIHAPREGSDDPKLHQKRE